VNIEHYFGSIQLLNGQVTALEVKGLLPYRIISLFSDLTNNANTCVFLTCPLT